MTPQDRRTRDLLLRAESATGELGSEPEVDSLISEGLVGVSFATRRSGEPGFAESSWLTPAGRAWLDAHETP